MRLVNAQLRYRKTYNLTPELFCKFLSIVLFLKSRFLSAFIHENTIMRKTLWKSFYAFSVLTLAMSFKTFSATEKDSIAVSSNTTAPEIKPQSYITNFVTEYLKKNGAMLDAVKLKSKASLSTIEKIFTKHGIPVELKYLAIIESKLKNTATSGTGAAGIWQLMPATAKALGLKINGNADERRYTYNSSVAAAKYLTILYKQFDDWLLVIAAYNSGAGTVYKAIKRSGSRDFWKLQNFLPRETRNHVKRFIATHYHYEENGSLVTLTKAEREIHLENVKEFIAIKKETGNQKELPASNQKYFTPVMIGNDDNYELKVMARR